MLYLDDRRRTLEQITAYHFKQFNKDDLYNIVSKYTVKRLHKIDPRKIVIFGVQRQVERIETIGLDIAYAIDDKIGYYSS